MSGNFVNYILQTQKHLHVGVFTARIVVLDLSGSDSSTALDHYEWTSTD